MPELPEVQTTVDGLNKKIRRRRIVDTWYDWHKFKGVAEAKGRSIKEIKRVGKNILFYFDDQHILLTHMKMTGHFLIGLWEIKGKKVTPLKPEQLKDGVNNYIHFILTLDDGQMIGFSDLRKFGKVVFGGQEKIENLPELKKLGPDALKVSYKEFVDRVRRRGKTIYQTLMDQTVVSGIGNIYANDVLWKAKVSPFKKANRLAEKELKELHKAIKTILNKALKERGTSVADYRDIEGKEGGYGNWRLVYQREGEGCKRCGIKIERKKVGGRSAHYCPKCQK